jgi:PTH1 family peptidyl-tRNA hydrolase
LFCLAGLGNPGPKYRNTRHNAGFLVIDRILDALHLTPKEAFNSLFVKTGYQGQDLILLKPHTYMNLSGQAVAAVVNYYKIETSKLLIIYDDLDLKVGATRLRLSGSAGGHRGLGSVIDHLKTDQIPRLRIGIGRPVPGTAVVDYVLTAMEEPLRSDFREGIGRAAEAGLSFVAKGPEFTMNRYNTAK